jgi:hypothetical protein
MLLFAVGVNASYLKVMETACQHALSCIQFKASHGKVAGFKKIKSPSVRNKTLLCQKVLKEYNDNCNEAMVAKRVASIAEQIYEDISVCPNTARSTTISDRDTIRLPVNTVANYKILPTMNAGDTYESMDVTTVLGLPH